MPLDLTPPRNVVGHLCDALWRHLAEQTDQQPRARVIQRFEFTCKLSHKMPRRYLQEMLPTAEDGGRMTAAESVRAGDDWRPPRVEWPVWRHFRDVCTRTTHTYDADSAAAALREIPTFLEVAGFLCGEFEKRIG